MTRSAENAAELFALLDLLPDPVLAIDPHGVLRHANLAAHDQIGRVLSTVLRHPAMQDLIRKSADDASRSADIILDVPIRRSIRATIGAAQSGDRFADRLGAGTRLVSLLDRTEQLAVARLRSDFVANANHELRTPLASLIGFIETLRGPAAHDPAAQRRFLCIMAEQAARMQRLIESLLSLSRIELTEHAKPRDRIALAPLIQGATAAMAPQIAARGATLALDLSSDLPVVIGDADQIQQVVQNLVGNAVKYAGGPITLQAARHQPSATIDPTDPWPEPGGVVMTVRDSGPGIAAHHLPRLTERFYRVPDTAGATGSGLGLAIVKHITGRHGGRMKIESEVGCGATVRVWFPAAPPPSSKSDMVVSNPPD